MKIDVGKQRSMERICKKKNKLKSGVLNFEFFLFIFKQNKSQTYENVLITHIATMVHNTRSRTIVVCHNLRQQI